MSKIARKRAPLRTQLTKLEISVKAALSQPPDLTDLQIKFEKLEGLWCQLEDADKRVLDELLDGDADEAAIEAEMSACEAYQDVFLALKVNLRNVLEPLITGTGPGGGDTARQDKKRTFKLPVLPLMKFSGDLKSWSTWWSQFQKIHDDKGLDASDKFQYLLDAMEVGSHARDIVATYHQSPDSYKEAVEALKEAFGRDDLQLQHHVRELLTLVISNVTNKEKMPLSVLSLKLEANLRCLSSLKLDKADPSTWLFPLVESSLSEETHRVWERSALSKEDGSRMVPPKTRLDFLMEFIKGEVRTEQRIVMAQSAFQSTTIQDAPKHKGKGKATAVKNSNKEEYATAAGLISGQVSCGFCGGRHESDRCWKAIEMTYAEKIDLLKKKKLCYKCILPFHPKSNCKVPVKCISCKGEHLTIVCPGERKDKKKNIDHGETEKEKTSVQVQQPVMVQPSTSSASSNICSSDVLLNTLQVKVIGEKGSTTVRMVGDTGSQRSYIKKNVVRKLGLKQVGHEYIQNVLFGGATTQPIYSGKYAVTLADLNGQQTDELKLLERPEICGSLPKVPHGPWLAELEAKGIQLSDVGQGCAEVDILVGSDYWGTLLTGNYVRLTSGLLAVETKFGWTVSGRVPSVASNMAVNVTSSLLSSSMDLSQLWSLEAIGIKDPIEVVTKEDEELQALQHFRENVARDEEGRYIVALPWKTSTSILPTNRNVAEKRLERATQQLQKQEKFEAYDRVFQGWEKEGIIKVVEETEVDGHYLPHRPVFKDSVTTPVRPVFDASCKVGRFPALNDCLYKGPNLLEVIPALLVRFREKPIGVSADIRKAFQMIRVRDEDQKFQKFLWWKDASCKEIIVYQHLRVVFGMNCSPYLLAATINHHLNSAEDSRWIAAMIIAYYVDNLVLSVSSVAEYEELRRLATMLMNEAGMELRQWARNFGDEIGASSSTDDGCGLISAEKDSSEPDVNLSVLGVIWDRNKDTLSCVIPEVEDGVKYSKKMILSLVARTYDPIGFLAPALVPLKCIIQETWKSGIGWDEVLPADYQKIMAKWIRSMHMLGEIRIPRVFQVSTEREIHVFVDASSSAYAAVVFMRSTYAGAVSVQLILAKSRVAPTTKRKNSQDSKPTIPRLELLACVIGTRLAIVVRNALDDNKILFIFWSDSTTALAWIRRHEHWGAFVGNRVAEILKTTRPSQWKHVPGCMNPADLPSRGCQPMDLLKSKWWEGENWLKNDRSTWPNSEAEVDEEAVAQEKTKTAVLISVPVEPLRFSSYRKNVAVHGWVLRFINNCLEKSPLLRNKGPVLSVEEVRVAEVVCLKKIQDCFPLKASRIGGMAVFRDKDGVLRVQSRLINREDTHDFIYPILLPKEHPMVEALILDLHKFYGHAGIQIIMGKSREKYWILQTRRTVKRILRQCIRCRRHQAKALEVVPAALPSRRVDDCEPFQTTGVDLFGPLTLKDKSKVWVVIFTCAYYRCVYLDPVTSLSTEDFLGALERFIGLYGRPNTIYSDNGTNFHGAANLFKSMDWKEIEAKSNVRQIQWIFNPPTAAWWGGFWERLIRSVKDLMKRILGTSKLSYDQLRTCLAGVGATINDRPLTVVTEDNEDLIPLTPAMFIKRSVPAEMPETCDASFLQKGYIRMKALQQQLQERFRREYLSLLVQRGTHPKTPAIVEGAVVLVGADNKKRFQWVLGVVVELMPGHDGEARRVKLITQNGIMERPLQRLYPMEINCQDVDQLKEDYRKLQNTPAKKGAKKTSAQKGPKEVRVPVQRVVITKRGRVVRTPARYGQWPI